MPKSPEQFDFSKQGDQDIFDKLGKNLKEKLIDKSHVEANRINEKIDSGLADHSEEAEKSHAKERAKEVQMGSGSIETAVETLFKFKDQGQSVYINFNGHKLYSVDVTMDSAFLEIVGKTKSEYDEYQRKQREEYRKKQVEEEARAKEKIPAWKKMGKKLGVNENKLAEWDRMVESRAEDLYHGRDLDAAIEIIQALNNGESYKSVKTKLDNQNHSGASQGIVKTIVSYFSNRGKEFVSKIDKSDNK